MATDAFNRIRMKSVLEEFDMSGDVWRCELPAMRH